MSSKGKRGRKRPNEDSSSSQDTLDLDEQLDSFAGHTSQISNFDKASLMIENGVQSADTFGGILLSGISDGSISDVQLIELTMKSSKSDNVINLMEFGKSLLSTTNSNPNNKLMTLAFLNNAVKMRIEQQCTKTERSLNKLSLQQTPTEAADLQFMQKPLESRHEILAMDPFEILNLNEFVVNFNVRGTSIWIQLSSVLIGILKVLTHPRGFVWLYGYSPTGNTDPLLKTLPAQIVDPIIDFMMDTMGIYLPPDLVNKPIETVSEADEFVQKLGETEARRKKELERRQSLHRAYSARCKRLLRDKLNYIRELHLDENELLYCQADTCTHIKWKTWRKAMVDGDDETMEEIQQAVLRAI